MEAEADSAVAAPAATAGSAVKAGSLSPQEPYFIGERMVLCLVVLAELCIFALTPIPPHRALSPGIRGEGAAVRQHYFEKVGKRNN
jgi:hypothetical protein